MAETRWLNAQSAATYLDLDKDAFLRQVKRGKLPGASYHLGPRLARWDRDALDSKLKTEPASDFQRSVSQAVNDILTKGRARRQKGYGGRERKHLSISRVVIKAEA